MTLDPCHIDYLVAYGISQDEYDFEGLIAEGVFGYALSLDDERHDGIWVHRGYTHIIRHETIIDLVDLPDAICGTKKTYPKPQIIPDTVEPSIASIVDGIDEMFTWNDNEVRNRENTSLYEFHDGLKYALSVLACRYGLTGIEEYYVDNRGDGGFGYIDVVWVDENNIPVVAIEIDSKFREQSIFKLRRIEAPLKFWIFYNPVNYNPMNITDVIIIPKLRVRYPAATREVTGATIGANCAPCAPRKLSNKSYRPICPFGYCGTFLCSICVKMQPFDGRRLFCPVGEMW